MQPGREREGALLAYVNVRVVRDWNCERERDETDGLAAWTTCGDIPLFLCGAVRNEGLEFLVARVAADVESDGLHVTESPFMMRGPSPHRPSGGLA